jgi:aminoglycoside 3-N-acetyltransferase
MLELLPSSKGGIRDMQVTQKIIRKVVEVSGLANKLVCIHSSLRSFGNVVGGSDSVINSFLELGCTLLAPSFTYDFQLPPMEDLAQNGLDASMDDFESTGQVYNPAINDITCEMGAIPRVMLNTAGRHRGIHPTNSFVALGSGAKALISCQTCEDVYAPFRKMMDEGGFIVLMGVDLTKMTAIHYAEQLSGRKLLIRWALDINGVPVRIREGSCSEGFNNLHPFVAEFETQITVGNSLWRIFPIYETVHACAEAIKENSGITHCGDVNCACCNDMQKGGPVLV